MDDRLVGIRLRDTAQADDYRVAGDLELHVGDLVLVETSAESTIGEVRRPRREIPEAKRDRLYRRVLRHATEAEARAYRERRGRVGRVGCVVADDGIGDGDRRRLDRGVMRANAPAAGYLAATSGSDCLPLADA